MRDSNIIDYFYCAHHDTTGEETSGHAERDAVAESFSDFFVRLGEYVVTHSDAEDRSEITFSTINKV